MMITNQNDITEYTNYNKIYIPTDYYNQNFKYNFSGDYIIIRTNQNCRTQNTNQYCNCYQYRIDTNTPSTAYECNYTSTSNQTIAFEKLSTDINDSMYIRERYIQDKGLILGLFIVGIIFAILLTRRASYR